MTKTIELTQGLYTLVDDDLYEWLNQWEWCASKEKNVFYARRNCQIGDKRFPIRMHRQILGLTYKDGRIADHINRNGLDNRLTNLRIVNHNLNSRNQRMHSNNTSGYRGVTWSKLAKKWIAKIDIDKRRIHLGCFTNILDAAEARKQGELSYWKQT